MAGRHWIGLCLLCVLILTAGCGKGAKTVAKVNDDVVTEEEFFNRVQSVNSFNLQNTTNKAGDYAMVMLIDEKLALQQAAEKKLTATDAQVTDYVQVCKQLADRGDEVKKKIEDLSRRAQQTNNPTLLQQAEQIGNEYQQYIQIFQMFTYLRFDPYRTDADWKRDAKVALAQRSLFASAGTPDEAKVKEFYDRAKEQFPFKMPNRYHVRVLSTNDAAKVDEFLKGLKSGISFETMVQKTTEEASKEPDPAKRTVAAQDFDEQVETDIAKFPAPISNALKTLKPGDYTQTPVKITPPKGATGPNAKPVFVIVQLADKKVDTPMPYESVKMFCENYLMATDQTTVTRVREADTEFRKKAKVEVSLKGYEQLVQKITNPPAPKTPAAPPAAPVETPTPAPAPGNTTPPGPKGQATPPGPKGGTMTPGGPTAPKPKSGGQ